MQGEYWTTIKLPVTTMYKQEGPRGALGCSPEDNCL